MSQDGVRVGLVGLGTVGTGVAKVLLEHGDFIERRAGRKIEVGRVVVKDRTKSRGVTLPPGVLSDQLDTLLKDPTVGVGIELIGGLHPAREIVLAMLEAGKDVVTANKALLCEHGDELFAKAKQCGRTIAFEAAVAGGIPIIATVGQCLSANQITSISAILNGTSNFILSQMIRHNRAYSDALQEAQALGYAEADPTLDVDGSDAAQKLVILAQLAYGVRIPFGEIPRQGIDKLDLTDVRYAAELGYTVKLLAQAKLVDHRIEMHVLPTLVPRHTPLAEVDGPYNTVGIVGNVVGETWYSGPGAGQFATASSVLADIIDTVTGRTRLTFPLLDLWRETPPFALQPFENFESRFYMRFSVEDRPHVLADVADILGRNEISISSVIQKEAPASVDRRRAQDRAPVPLVIMTHRTREGNLQQAERAIAKLNTVRPNHVRMPVVD